MKSAKCNEHQNQSSEVFWAQKPQIQSKKYPKPLKRKSQCPLSLCTDSTVYLYCFHWDSSKKTSKNKSFILIMIVRTVLILHQMIHLAPRGNFKHQIDYHYFQNVISFSFSHFLSLQYTGSLSLNTQLNSQDATSLLYSQNKFLLAI